MHQSVVEYEVASAAMSVVPTAGTRFMQRGWIREVLRAEAMTANAASGFAPRGRTARLGSYVRAAGIAAGLVAAWLGLSVI